MDSALLSLTFSGRVTCLTFFRVLLKERIMAW